MKVKLNSSAIASAEYDETIADLTIQFHDGSEYTHTEVPREIAVGLIESESVGRFYNLVIRGKFGS